MRSAMPTASSCWTGGASSSREPTPRSPRSAARSPRCSRARWRSGLLLGGAHTREARGGFRLVALGGDRDRLHLHDLGLLGRQALRRHLDGAHLAHFLAAGNAVQLLLGKLAVPALLLLRHMASSR